MLKHCVIGLFIGTLALGTALSQHTPGKVDFRRDVQFTTRRLHCDLL
jgi:hypothetical protein